LDFTSWEPFYSDFSLEHGRKIMQPISDSSYDWMDSSQTTNAKVEVVQTTDEWIDKCTNIPRIKSFTTVTGPLYYDTLTFVMACDTASDGEQTENLQLGGETNTSPAFADLAYQWAFEGVTTEEGTYHYELAKALDTSGFTKHTRINVLTSSQLKPEFRNSPNLAYDNVLHSMEYSYMNAESVAVAPVFY